MKLTNPTDDELNAAFATEVAGVPDAQEWWTAHPEFKKQFTTSADAVLPWLEKKTWPQFAVTCEYDNSVGKWHVKILPIPEDVDCEHGIDPLLPRAAVIALLRAHGVKVEFTP